MSADADARAVEATWRRYDDDEQRLSAPLSERMLDLAGVGPGTRVLDLATGRGEPAIRAAHRVGPTGAVLGVDIAPAMLRMARERADREHVENLDLRELSAERLDGVPDAGYDVVLARWCLMYMADPRAAIREAARALVPGGRLVAATWAEPEKVSYYTLPRRALAPYREVPTVDVHAPGTFYYSDPAALTRDLEAAGFTVDSVEAVQVDVMEARTDAELFAWTRAFGLGRLLDGLSAELQGRWEADLVAAAAAHRVDGVVRLGGTSWVVAARARAWGWPTELRSEGPR